jgi:plasmid stability protein
MPKMIQIRHVPDAVHRKLKARAANLGLSLSDYLMQEIIPLAELPTMSEFLERLEHREKVTLREASAVTVRRGREGR